MMYQRTSVGLDVHARSVVACGLDGETGEVVERRLTPQHTELLDWIRKLPPPVAVTYEAGPTGYGLARFLDSEGISCLVAAPSKLQRPPGDRVKTDTRDARHLAKLLHLGQIVAVMIPSPECGRTGQTPDGRTVSSGLTDTSSPDRWTRDFRLSGQRGCDTP
ncbi:IS110 family transposase, partial [Antrihabitans stalactiti]|uniref:IS110 family transposase n=1 Tax=Antrihabitans stalactiti TaxID=2584121 RepID=UPI003B8484CF